VVDPPEGVEVSVRQGEGRSLLFVINHTEGTQTVSVPAGKGRLLEGGTTGETLDLEAYGVAVIRL
jgi:beta-galactosidase